MATPKEVLWELKPPTVGKHIVLREYLKAWLPILGMRQQLVFIDGFAGPGKYTGGEDGSPIIALKTANEHHARERLKALHFFFVEEDAARAAHLAVVVDQLRPTLRANIHAAVLPGSFGDIAGSTLAQIAAAGRTAAPTLLMVDPLGVKGVSLRVLAEFLKNGQAELFISFMAEAVHRFATTDEFEPHLNELFGGSDWRDVLEGSEAMEMLFERKLRGIGAKYVLRFRVQSGQRHIYTLFFATKHSKGCDRMKQAMWKAAPDGSYVYEPAAAAAAAVQLQFFDNTTATLSQELMAQFKGRGAIPVEELETWIKGDQTLHHSGHLRKALAQLETSGQLRFVNPSRKRRKGTFPLGTSVELGGPW